MTERQQQLQQLEAQLDKSPADWDLRLIYADLLDEEGDCKMARCQRWMVAKRLYPVFDDPHKQWFWGTEENINHVFSGSRAEADRWCLLPEGLLPRLILRRDQKNQNWVGFDSPSAAERFLAESLTEQDCIDALAAAEANP